MLRGIGRLRAGGGSAFSTASLFTGGAKGLWIDPPSWASTFFQDAAGTSPVTAMGQPVGKELDKSGNANHFSQATSTARAVLSTDGTRVYEVLDGVDDGYSTATFAAGTLSANMDCFVVVKRNADTRLVLAFPAAGTFFGYADPGNASATYSGCGTPTIAVNGTSVAGGTAATAGALAAAIGVGQWAVLEVRNLDLSAWTAMQIGNYPAYASNVALGPIVLCPAQDAATRTKLRQNLAAAYGVTLA